MRLVYAEDAVADLVRLRAFVAEKDPSAAARVAEELISRIENLSRFPEMGRPVALAPDPEAVRDMVAGKYVVRYTARTDVIIILRLWHHHEDR